jgi:glycosyltransferase involved in cell wall biosynthesis
MIDPSLFTLPYDSMLARGLQEIGHDIILHTRALRPGEIAPEGATLTNDFYQFTEGKHIASLPNSLRLTLKGVDHFYSMGQLSARLRRDRPDIIHFQWLPLPVLDQYFLPTLAKIAPVILTVHDSKPFNGNPASRIQKLGASKYFGAFDRLIVHTESFRRNLLSRGLSSDRVVRIPHGLLGQKIVSKNNSSIPTLDNNLPTFLLFGQIKPYKGIDIMVKAFSRLPEPLRNRAKMRVVGKSHMDLTPLVDLAHSLGIASRLVIEQRFVPDENIPDLFDTNSIAIFPYTDIEASGVLTLAIAYGRPIIASRIGSFAEELRDGVHGILVPPGDPVALANAMQKFLTDSSFSRSCAENIRELAAEAPSWIEIGRKTAAVYASVLPSRRQHAFSKNL